MECISWKATNRKVFARVTDAAAECRMSERELRKQLKVIANMGDFDKRISEYTTYTAATA